MEIKRFIESKIARAALVLGIGAAKLTGCADYEGKDNQFVISGPVHDVGEHSVKITPVNVTEAEGKSRKWFKDGKDTRVHDNYKHDWCNITDVGIEFARDGQPQTLNDLQEGEWVELSGSIRDSKVTCGKNSRWETRPVYTVLREIPS